MNLSYSTEISHHGKSRVTHKEREASKGDVWCPVLSNILNSVLKFLLTYIASSFFLFLNNKCS